MHGSKADLLGVEYVALKIPKTSDKCIPLSAFHEPVAAYGGLVFYESKAFALASNALGEKLQMRSHGK